MKSKLRSIWREIFGAPEGRDPEGRGYPGDLRYVPSTGTLYIKARGLGTPFGWIALAGSSEIAALTSQVATLNNQVAGLSGDVSTINGQISSINTNLGTLNSDVALLTTRITALETQAAAMVRTVQREVSDLIVSNTIVITPLLQYTIPQDDAQAGDVYRLIVVGDYFNNSGSNAIFNLRFSTIPTTLWNATATFPTAASAHGFWIEFDFAVHTDILQFLNGIVIVGNEAVPITGIGTFDLVNTTAVLEGIPGILNISLQPVTLSVEFSHNIANPDLVLTRRAAWVERLGIAA